MSVPRQSRQPVDPASLALPAPAIPRPGESVVWFQQNAPVSGVLGGHGADGRPRVKTVFGTISAPPSYDVLRLDDPFDRRAPNWTRLPSGALLLRPTDAERDAFDSLLDQRTPPGPTYRELVQEIWARGFETFVVGGTVRDVLAGSPSKDVDLVTTMPVDKALPLVRSMYGRPTRLEPPARTNGHLRLGGAPGTADPYIDLSVFKDRFVGSDDAVFGDDFAADLGNRDFACNAVYYDALNQVLIDPSGHGISDAQLRCLRLVCDPARRSPSQLAQIAVRYFKFVDRGFQPTVGCDGRIAGEFIPMLAAMPAPYRIRYVRTQLFARAPGSDRAQILARLEQGFVAIGAAQAYQAYVEPIRNELVA